MKCLGIDIGSTSIKGGVLDVDGGDIGTTVRRSFPEPVTGLPPGHFEIQPQQVADTALEVLEDLARQEPTARHVFFSGQMGGVLLVDRAGEPATNYISWRDQRTLTADAAGRSSFDRMLERLSKGQVANLGRELKPGAATSLLFWLAEHQKLSAGDRPLTLGDYVIAELCGAEPATEPTQGIGTLNLRTGDWDHEVFKQLGFPDLEWPVLRSYSQASGQVEINGTMLTCHPVVGDHQCALLGIGLDESELSINISTGSQVSRLAREWQPGEYQTRPYFDGMLLNTLTHLPAGRSLNVLVDLLTELTRRAGGPVVDPWTQISAAVAETREATLQVDLAFFASPVGIGHGKIDGITTENLTVGNLFLAAFQNMAQNYRCCADRLIAGGSWSRLVLSGGLSEKFPILKELILREFTEPHRECPEGEDTLLGLLQLARRTLCADSWSDTQS